MYDATKRSPPKRSKINALYIILCSPPGPWTSVVLNSLDSKCRSWSWMREGNSNMLMVIGLVIWLAFDRQKDDIQKPEL